MWSGHHCSDPHRDQGHPATAIRSKIQWLGEASEADISTVDRKLNPIWARGAVTTLSERCGAPSTAATIRGAS
jgi:hypothetical protein